LSLALLCCLPLVARAQAPCTHYASPGGGGNGLSQGSPFTIANFWSVAGPGKTLCLLDGTYTGASMPIIPPAGLHGSPGNPITIRALHDGGAFLDGEFQRQPIWLNHQWWVLEGFSTGRSPTSVVIVGEGSANVIIRRVIAWDAEACQGVNNQHVFHVTNDTSDVLLEDVAAWGCGGKMFARQSDTRTTFRRCFALKTHDVQGGVALTTAY